ncbi:hypothetical protein SESBI_31131 [Sesbania bispinosa]|nr:hypothetical protein SESBI_31131 [Sesbania bispinosa]
MRVVDGCCQKLASIRRGEGVFRCRVAYWKGRPTLRRKWKRQGTMTDGGGVANGGDNIGRGWRRSIVGE